MGRRQRLKWPIVSGADDLVDLALRLLVVQVMDFHFGGAGIPQVPFAIHVAGVASHCASFRILELTAHYTGFFPLVWPNDCAHSVDLISGNLRSAHDLAPTSSFT